MLAAGTNVQWLRDDLGLIASSDESHAVAAQCDDTGGVVYVPALLGLGTPAWDYGARAAFFGLTRGTGRPEMVRAVLEGIAHRGADLVEAAEADSGIAIPALRVDGGMTDNTTFVQALADAAQKPVEISPMREATSRGAALMAGLAVGHHGSVDDLARTWQPRVRVEPDARARPRPLARRRQPGPELDSRALRNRFLRRRRVRASASVRDASRPTAAAPPPTSDTSRDRRARPGVTRLTTPSTASATAPIPTHSASIVLFLQRRDRADAEHEVAHADEAQQRARRGLAAGRAEQRPGRRCPGSTSMTSPLTARARAMTSATRRWSRSIRSSWHGGDLVADTEHAALRRSRPAARHGSRARRARRVA